jgi:hypothetical protein
VRTSAPLACSCVRVSLTSSLQGNTMSSEGKKAEAEFEKKFYAGKSEASKKFETARQEASKQVNGAIDTFDKTATEKAGQAKGWFSGWFGSK